MHKHILIVIFGLALAACQNTASAGAVSAPESSPSATPSAPVTLTLTLTSTPPAASPTPAPPLEWSLWKGGPHPAAGVDCARCHGKDMTGLALTPAANGALSLPDASLCSQCHADADLLRGVDKTLAHQGLKCLDCHNPHSTAASCANAGCHAQVRKLEDMPPSTPTSGHRQTGAAFCGGPNCHPAATQAALNNPGIHGASHFMVTCQACHAAAGLQVGPLGADGAWITTRADPSGAAASPVPFSSHSVQKAVDCARCHFQDNPWKLPTVSGHEFGN